MVALTIALAAVFVAAIVAIRRRSRLPSRLAAKRLKVQLADLERQLSDARRVDKDVIPTQQAAVRAKWIEDRARATQIESVEAQGMGPASHQALRAAGVNTLADLRKFENYAFKVPTIGDKRRTQLLDAQRSMREQLVKEAQSMNDAELDEASGGQLATLIRRVEREELEKRRAADALSIRIHTIQRRRTSLKT